MKFWLAILLPAALLADTVVLRDGSVLRGRVTARDPSVIVIEVEGKPVVVPKASIRLFREDQAGLEHYNRTRAEAEQAQEARDENLAKQIAAYPFPDGLLIRLGAGQGKHKSALAGIVTDDRTKDNIFTRGNPASFNTNFQAGPDRGVEGRLQYRSSRWFVEAGGASYAHKISYQSYGLPPVTSVVVPTAATVDQLGILAVSPLQKQDAYGIAGFEPRTFGAALRWYLFYGASGIHQLVRIEGPVGLSVRLGSFSATDGLYIDNFESVASAQGTRGGIDLRYRLAGGTEIQLRGTAAEMHGWTRGRGTVLSSSYANAFQDGRVRFRSISGELTVYVPVASRMRVYVSGYSEEYRQTLSHRTDFDFPSALSPSNIDFRKNIVRLYDKPTHSGRINRFSLGTEFRI